MKLCESERYTSQQTDIMRNKSGYSHPVWGGGGAGGHTIHNKTNIFFACLKVFHDLAVVKSSGYKAVTLMTTAAQLK